MSVILPRIKDRFRGGAEAHFGSECDGRLAAPTRAWPPPTENGQKCVFVFVAKCPNVSIANGTIELRNGHGRLR